MTSVTIANKGAVKTIKLSDTLEAVRLVDALESLGILADWTV